MQKNLLFNYARIAVLVVFGVMAGEAAFAQMSGTFTINSSGSGTRNFTSFTSAVDTLTKQGVNGPVVFNVADGVYGGTITIKAINGSSISNTITFQSQSHDSTKVKVEGSGISANNIGILNLLGSSWLVFNQVTFQDTSQTKFQFGSQYGYSLIYSSASTNNIISNCRILGSKSQEFLVKFYYGGGTRYNTFIDSNNTLINNYLNAGGNYTIYIEGDASGAANTSYCRSDRIIGNSIENTVLGLIASESHGFEISKNIIKAKRGTSESGYGVLIGSCSGPIKITSNKIKMGDSTGDGISIAWCSGDSAKRLLVANNFVSNAGIDLGGNYFDIFYNNVNGYFDVITCLSLTGYNNEISIEGNVFANYSGLYAFTFDQRTTNSIIDYNDYYTNGNTLVSSNNGFSNLNSWQKATKYDAHSISVNPNYINDSDLHATNDSLSGAGIAISGITTDIDGNPRPNPPTIGANEIKKTDFCLSGSYTIGASGADYPTFNAAVAALDSFGVCGPVVFNVDSGDYPECLDIKYIKGVSAVNTITFQSANGNAYVNLFNTWTDSTNLYHADALFLDGAQWIIINNLSLYINTQYNPNNLIADSGSTIEIGPNSFNNTITNCYLGDDNQGYGISQYVIDIYGFDSANIISNNSIYYDNSQAHGNINEYGIVKITGNNGKYSIGNSFLKNNIIEPNGESSIFSEFIFNISQQKRFSFIGNVEYNDLWLSGTEFQNDSFINVSNNYFISDLTDSGVGNSHISSFTIDNCPGIDSNHYSMFCNNEISIFSYAPINIGIIDLKPGPYSKICFNNFSTLTDLYDNYIGLYFRPNNNNYFENNVIVMADSDFLIDISPAYSSVKSFTMDYNSYYSIGDSLFGICDCYEPGSSHFYKSLSAWQSASSLDKHSIWANPNYITNKAPSYPYFDSTELNSTNSSLSGAGIAISGITSDIRGYTRPNPPGIGANEIFFQGIFADFYYQPDTLYLDSSVSFFDYSYSYKCGAINSWYWDFGDGSTSTIQNPKHTYKKSGSFIVWLSISSSGGCYNAYSQTIWVDSTKKHISAHFSLPDTLCLQSPILFSDSSTSDSCGTISSWLWSYGDGNTDTAQNPYHTYTKAGSFSVKLKVSSSGGCTDSFSKKIWVDSTCVWPGDADNNKIVNIADVLNIGVGYNVSGPKRTNIAPVWEGEYCDNWKDTFMTGANFKHADCNGDGKIDSSDLILIGMDWSDTHKKTGLTSIGNPNDPPFYLKFAKDNFHPGDNVSADLILGDAAKPMSNVYGFAFEFNYNPADIQNKTMKLQFTNSWFGTPGTDAIYYIKNDSINGQLAAAITRIDHTNVSGLGKIGTISFIASKTRTEKSITFSPNLAKLISYQQANIPVYLGIDSITAVAPTGISTINKTHTNVNIYPNPANNLLNIEAKGDVINSITFFDAMGKEIYHLEAIKTQKQSLDFSHFTSGLYVVKLQMENGCYVGKVVVN